MRRLLPPLLLLALLVGLAFKGRLLELPEVRAEPVAGQSEARAAVSRLARVLGDQRPHSVDTAANDAVRARIVAELRAIGANPRITDDFACNGAADARTVGCTRVRNIVATIGPAGPGHLLLVSHYDSTPVGPGAADDGIGVAVMLEVAAHLARRDLKRPVSLLFNEGEESGLIGARAFRKRDPLARNVTRLINLEGRGVEGPAIMFETSTPNAAAIDWYAAAVARPVANSLSTTRKRWAATAPAGLTQSPQVIPLGRREIDGGRVVSLRLVANGAETITLLAPPAAKVARVDMGGWSQRMGELDKPAKDAGPNDTSRHYAVRCQGPSCDGMRVDLTLASRAPMVWTAIGNRSGLPPQARVLLAARPADAAPQYTADATIGVATLRF